MPRPSLRLAAALAVAVAVTLFAPAIRVAHGDGGPSNALLIIDPTDADSLYLGHAYAARRSIPPSNVLYLPPAAGDYASWAAFQRHAVTGTLASRGLSHVDHIVIAPSKRFYMPMATNLVGTGCGVVSRMSLSSAYTFLPEADEVLGGTLTDQDVNRYRGEWRRPSDALAFDSATRWYNGKPATSGGARRYFVGTLLGYLGERGNTVDEVAAMIERSTAVDGTRPDGTFYFMNVAGEVRNYRSSDFPDAMKAITAMGGKAETLDGLVPGGRHDALGILTGTTHPSIVGADVTIHPGAFADHLTSFAATYDEGGQEKMSSWITAGASATLGTVEEPCTGGKFPDAALHAFYFAGLPLGEAIFRSVQWSAFQSLFLGDPLTRPFTHIPTVTVDGLPKPPATAKGIVDLTARASTTAPGGVISEYTLYVDGIAVATARDGRFALDTSTLAEGWHEARVAAVDGSAVRAVGEWRARFVVRNRTRLRAVEVLAMGPGTAPSGVATIGFKLFITSEDEPSEVRLLQDSRVVHAYNRDFSFEEDQLPATLFGAGRIRFHAVADYPDGGTAVSPEVVVEIDPSAIARSPMAGASRGRPVAIGYRLAARAGRPQLVDLPAWDAVGRPDGIVVDRAPSQAELRSADGAFLLLPFATAAGTDTLVYHATNTEGASEPATVTIDYCPATAPDDPLEPGMPSLCRSTAAPTGRAYLPVAYRAQAR